MTGCDLRYLAQECSRDVRGCFDRRAADAEAILHLVVTLKTTALADVPLAIEAIESRASSLAETLAANASEEFVRIEEMTDKVREHFHEAVDERVQAELQDGCYFDEEAKDEAVRQACDELREAIESDVVQAVRDAG